MIVISTKYTDRLILKDCLERICEFYPNEKVVIVDSNSKDMSFIHSVDVFDKIYNNLNYDTGAYYKAFIKYPNEPHYMFIHDSLMINKFYDFSSIDLKPIRHFRIQEDSTSDFTRHICSTIGIEYEYCYGCFGPMFISNNEIAHNTFVKLTTSILPSNKIEAMAYERIFGLIFKSLGKEINSSFQGEHIIDPYGPFDETYFSKIYLNRQ